MARNSWIGNAAGRVSARRNRTSSVRHHRNRLVGLPLVLAAICLLIPMGQLVTAQESSLVEQHLAAGEFSLAIEAANQPSVRDRDVLLSEIARAQLHSGATPGAFYTAQQIQTDETRSDTLSGLFSDQFGSPGGNGGFANPGQPMAGRPGGVTIQDFTPLINLIQNTVQPTSWQDNGGGNGTVQAYPSGVMVSADGTLKRISIEKSQRASKLRERAGNDSGNRVVTTSSDLRSVSLGRLERMAESCVAAGQPVSEEMQNLAGVYEITLVGLSADGQDLLIAGPAGPWEMGDQGRPVNIETGKPVLQLDDLVVCLRNALRDGGKFGCSITPREANLVATKKFLSTSDLKGKRWSEGLRDALGQQDIEVFGIPADSHAAQVLVEADYRMKLIGMGLEASVPEVPSYFDRLAERESLGSTDIVRWWFTMNYDDLVANADQTAFAMRGTGVQVLSENEYLSQQGQRVHTGKSNEETAGFAKDFTQHFSQLADRYPVYRQLKNVFDLALVAGVIQKYDLADRSGWKPGFFLGNRSNQLNYALRSEVTPAQVDSVLNEKTFEKRKARSTVKQRIIGVSGGIEFDAQRVVAQPPREDDGELDRSLETLQRKVDRHVWWWD